MGRGRQYRRIWYVKKKQGKKETTKKKVF
jgi:hypothetical protein